MNIEDIKEKINQAQAGLIAGVNRAANLSAKDKSMAEKFSNTWRKIRIWGIETKERGRTEDTLTLTLEDVENLSWAFNQVSVDYLAVKKELLEMKGAR